MALSARHGATLGGLGLGLMVAIWLVIRSTPASVAVTGPVRGAAPTTAPQLMPLPDEPVPAAMPQGEDAPAPESASAAMAQTRDAYLRFARYPPWSRPAEPQYEELYAFNQAPVTSEQAIGRIGAREVHASVTLDKGFVDAGHPARITVSCWLADGEAREPVAFTASAEVQVAVEDSAAQPIDTSPFMLGWQAVDGRIALAGAPTAAVHDGTLDVAQLPRLAERHRAARLVVYVTARGLPSSDGARPLALPFSYTARPPFRVVGVAGDALVHGSLEVELDVDVDELAPVRIRAALGRPGGQTAPIAIYDRPFRPERIGRQRTTITFFGKILHDAEQDGPYELFRLHGQVLVTGEPVPEVGWQDDRTFSTGSYHYKDFAPDDWSDPEKARMVSTYQRVAQQLH